MTFTITSQTEANIIYSIFEQTRRMQIVDIVLNQPQYRKAISRYSKCGGIWFPLRSSPAFGLRNTTI